MGTMVNGVWDDDPVPKTAKDGAFVRDDSIFRDQIAAGGNCRVEAAGEAFQTARDIDRIADDGSLVRFRALTTVVSCFDVFLGVIPHPARIGHHERHQDCGHQRAGE